MEFLEEAKTKKLALLVIGDPLSATTHFEIISECKKRDITYEIIHSVSVLTAVAETGLSLYKFGKTVSIPFDNENLDSPYEILNQETEAGKYIYSKAQKIWKKYDLILLKAKQIKPDKNLVIFTYSSESMSFTGEIANELNFSDNACIKPRGVLWSPPRTATILFLFKWINDFVFTQLFSFIHSVLMSVSTSLIFSLFSGDMPSSR